MNRRNGRVMQSSIGRDEARDRKKKPKRMSSVLSTILITPIFSGNVNMGSVAVNCLHFDCVLSCVESISLQTNKPTDEMCVFQLTLFRFALFAKITRCRGDFFFSPLLRPTIFLFMRLIRQRQLNITGVNVKLAFRKHIILHFNLHCFNVN